MAKISSSVLQLNKLNLTSGLIHNLDDHPIKLIGMGFHKARLVGEGDNKTVEWGDYVNFERLIFDGEYDRDCQGLSAKDAIGSEILLDDCGCEVRITACKQTVWLEHEGVYRAVYHGAQRPNISVRLSTIN